MLGEGNIGAEPLLRNLTRLLAAIMPMLLESLRADAHRYARDLTTLRRLPATSLSKG